MMGELLIFLTVTYFYEHSENPKRTGGETRGNPQTNLNSMSHGLEYRWFRQSHYMATGPNPHKQKCVPRFF